MGDMLDIKMQLTAPGYVHQRGEVTLYKQLGALKSPLTLSPGIITLLQLRELIHNQLRIVGRKSEMMAKSLKLF